MRTYMIKTDSGLYVSSFHSTPISEDTGSQGSSSTEIPTELSTTTGSEDLDVSSTIIAVTEEIHATEQTNTTTTSSQGEHDVSGDIVDQTTELPIMTTEVRGEDNDRKTESPELTKDLGTDTENHTAIIPSLDSNGSGMGETTQTTTTEADTGGAVVTSEDHESSTGSTTGKEQETKRFLLQETFAQFSFTFIWQPSLSRVTHVYPHFHTLEQLKVNNLV